MAVPAEASFDFGMNVFSIKMMRNYLSRPTYQALSATILKGERLDPALADDIAEAMKTWALERGATHYTHWFQPLTGATAEKHDSFLMPDGEGGMLTSFSGKELAQGEADGSSFPSGGIRATFEARGYTAWDPSSPAFIKVIEDVSVLCIPTIFCGYNGEALDKKTPLLRSQETLSAQISRMAVLFGIKPEKYPRVLLGVEQEYFLVPQDHFFARQDLLLTGRTLFGHRPPRHQQMSDHYYGCIRPRVLKFMAELDRELWKLGVPAKTRHNEVAPAQFEIASVYEDQNLAIDHNMIAMQVMEEVAERNALVCLLHEKPFKGVNGSGKHNNFSFEGPDGKNWFKPGSTPHDNAKFLMTICAVVKAVDQYSDILRASVASAGNDHRLGAHEAPPAIISVYLGEQLTDIINQIIEKGGATRTKSAEALTFGVNRLMTLPRDATDRNRTSPMAFTGNKFEFRAVGSGQSCSGPNVVLNTTVAWAIDELCSAVEKRTAAGEKFEPALQKVLSENFKKHRRILFDGDNYSTVWKKEAAKRGLPDVPSSIESLKAFIRPESIELFRKYQVLSERELKSRYEIYAEAYQKTVGIEAGCVLEMGRALFLPAALDFSDRLLTSPTTAKSKTLKALSKRVVDLCDSLSAQLDKLELVLGKPRPDAAAQRKAAEGIRETVDELETLVPGGEWPVPSYMDMFFTL